MLDYRRTHDCGSLRKEDSGKSVALSGWVNRRRDHGGLIFIDLRDRFGITQLVFDPEKNPEAHSSAEKLRGEWVISIRGKVSPRREGMANPKLSTGDIEVFVDQLEILSKARTPPFSICDDLIEVNEELRLKYRYLDIRRGDIAHKLVQRHKAMIATRKYLDHHGFLEIATPILGKSTPEGRPRLPCPLQGLPRELLRIAAISPDLQTTVDGLRHGPLLPNRHLLPRRRPARGPTA